MKLVSFASRSLRTWFRICIRVVCVSHLIIFDNLFNLFSIYIPINSCNFHVVVVDTTVITIFSIINIIVIYAVVFEIIIFRIFIMGIIIRVEDRIKVNVIVVGEFIIFILGLNFVFIIESDALGIYPGNNTDLINCVIWNN